MQADGIATGTAYRKAGEFAVRTIGGETVLVPIRSGVGQLDAIFTLNEVGGRIWSLLEAQSSVEEIVSKLCDEYAVAADEARRDVDEFLSSLVGAGVLEPDTAP